MRRVAVVISMVLLTTGIAMATSDSETIEVANVRTFGLCTVRTRLDMLTDETWHTLECKDEGLFDTTIFGVSPS